MCAKLDSRKAALQDLKKKYKGFKILRGYEEHKGRYKQIVLILIKVKKPRMGTFTRFCEDRLKENKSIIVCDPTTVAMYGALQKNRFVCFARPHKKSEYWILTPLTPKD